MGKSFVSKRIRRALSIGTTSLKQAAVALDEDQFYNSSFQVFECNFPQSSEIFHVIDENSHEDSDIDIL